MIHSVSYEAGVRETYTPTLSDGYDWLDVLRTGLTNKMKWPEEYNFELDKITYSLQHPQNMLPSFNKDNLSKLESTMQENLFSILNNSPKFMFGS